MLCEGDTEELAVRHFILPQWNSEGFGAVGLKCINLDGKIEKLGKFAGGYLDDQEVLAVFTLVNLQGMTKVTHQHTDTLETNIRRVRDWLRAQVNHARANRYFPHVCVHQTEAWILAEGHALSARLGNPNIGPDLRAEFKNFQNPPSTSERTFPANQETPLPQDCTRHTSVQSHATRDCLWVLSILPGVLTLT